MSMNVEKTGTLEQRAIRNGRAIDMQWIIENEADELRDWAASKSDKIDGMSLDELIDYKEEVKEILEIVKSTSLDDDLNKNLVDSSERKKIEIYTEQDAEAERQKGFDIPRQYVILNGDKYYFSQEYVPDLLSKSDISQEQIARELSEATGIEMSPLNSKKGHYKNVGLLPNGNMILNDPLGMVGMINPYGDILIDFNYHSLNPITNKNGEIVHDECLIAESNSSYFSNAANRIVYPTGIVNVNGTELYPIDDSNVEDISYDALEDVFHCCNYNDWVGLANSKTGFDKDIKTIEGYDLEFDRYTDLEENILG